jgi:hypothetical protein
MVWSMGDPIGLNERLRLRRWLAAVGLTAAAEDAARVDTAETNAMALLSAHAACEALLGLLDGVRRHKPGEDVSFGRLLDSAQAKVTFDIGLADDLDAMHRIRNDFVHASNTVAADEAARAIWNARRLMELAPVSLSASWSLPAGAGLGTAVAEIIDVEAVGMWLRHADLKQREGCPQLAADGLARALHSALDRTNPGLVNDGAATILRISRQSQASAYGRDFGADVTQSQIDGLYRWVLPLALGTSPAAYQRLLDVIGTVPNFDVLAPVDRAAEVVVTDGDVRWAASQTAEIIFRLWAMGSLQAGSDDDKIVERAQPLLAEPAGSAAGEPRS